MTDKELRKLKRAELLEILIEQRKEIARLEDCLKEAEDKLKSREITIQRAGSIAEAALQLNHVFEDAQKAADQYLESIRLQTRQQEGTSEAAETESTEENHF